MPRQDAGRRNRSTTAPTEAAATSGTAAPREGAGTTGGVIEQAKQKTGQVVEQVQQQAATRLDRQKENAVTGLSRVADTVRQMGQNLRGQEQQGAIAEYAAQYGERAAEQIERFTDYLREHDVNQLVGEVEDFARRQPVIFIGGAFLLGFAGARFLKSSSPARDVTGGAPDAGRALPPAPATGVGGAAASAG